MALEFAICKICNESHAIQKSGVMSIHTDESGKRCAGSSRPQSGSQSRSPQRKAPMDPVEVVDEERKAAFEVAAEAKQRRNLDRGFDRRIYVTGRPVVYNGGTPGSRRR